MYVVIFIKNNQQPSQRLPFNWNPLIACVTFMGSLHGRLSYVLLCGIPCSFSFQLAFLSGMFLRGVLPWGRELKACYWLFQGRGYSRIDYPVEFLIERRDIRNSEDCLGIAVSINTPLKFDPGGLGYNKTYPHSVADTVRYLSKLEARPAPNYIYKRQPRDQHPFRRNLGSSIRCLDLESNTLPLHHTVFDENNSFKSYYMLLLLCNCISL